MFECAHVRLNEELTSIDIYPPFTNQLLGKGLHYFAVIERNGACVSLKLPNDKCQNI
jgi:hypothetical protein